MNLQIINYQDKPAFAVVPIDEWHSLVSHLEDMQDINDAKNALGMESFPEVVIEQLLAGVHPQKVWRDYRGMTLQSLAEYCNVTQQTLLRIENNEIQPSIEVIAKLASVLNCDIDDLQPAN